MNSRALADIARGLDSARTCVSARASSATGGRDKNSILADTMEAVIGATYLSVGMEGAREFVLRLTSPLMDSSERLGAGPTGRRRCRS